MANNSIKAAFERLWQHVVAGLGGKSDVGHTHDDIYCTEAKVDSKLSAINTSISNITSGTTVVKKAESATTAGSATKATQDGNGKVISSTYETKTDATTKLNTAKAYTDSEMTRLVGDTAVSAQVSAALNTAKTYTDTEISELINSAPTTLDTLGEIATAMSENADVVEALEAAVGTKANASDLTAHTGNKSNPHGVTLAQLGVTATAAELNLLDGVTATTAELNYVDGVTSNIQTQLNGKAASSHGTHVTWSTTAPKVNGTAAVGSETKVARGDHVHPTDTSRAAASEVTALKSLVGDTAVATQISNAVAQKSAVQFITWEADD